THDRTVRRLLLDEIIQAFRHLAGVFLAVEVIVPGGLKREQRQAGLGDFVGLAGLLARSFLFAARVGIRAQAIGAPVSVFALVAGQPVQAVFDRLLRLDRSAALAEPFGCFGLGPLLVESLGSVGDDAQLRLLGNTERLGLSRRVAQHTGRPSVDHAFLLFGDDSQWLVGLCGRCLRFPSGL